MSVAEVSTNQELMDRFTDSEQFRAWLQELPEDHTFHGDTASLCPIGRWSQNVFGTEYLESPAHPRPMGLPRNTIWWDLYWAEACSYQEMSPEVASQLLDVVLEEVQRVSDE